MRFRGLDLNLLVALDALLATRSIARAALRTNLSQPAMSAALNRLRDYFRDELLVLEGRRFHLTSAARALVPLVTQCLRDADAIIAVTEDFDLQSSKRNFRIIASDYTMMVSMVPLARRIKAIAPGITLEFLPPQQDLRRQMEDGYIDLVIGPADYMITDQPHDVLYEEDHVVAGCAANPLLNRPLTVESYLAASHVVAMFGNPSIGAFGDQHVDALGHERHVEIRASSFGSVPWFLPGTQLLTLMQRRLAKLSAKVCPIRLAEMPLLIPAMLVVAQYHRARMGDPGLAWLRTELRAVVAASEAAPCSELRRGSRKA